MPAFSAFLGLFPIGLPSPAAGQNSPFWETFDATTLRNDIQTSANWDTAESRLTLPRRAPLTDPFNGGAPRTAPIGDGSEGTAAVASADFNGDGHPDLLIGNAGQPNRWFPNNGTAAPFDGVTGECLSADAHDTRSLAVGDVDGDGDIDAAVGNFGSANRLYLNNGGPLPFSDATGSNISSDADDTTAILLHDLDGDGDLDLIAGAANNQPLKLYLNNGTADPFAGVQALIVGFPDRDTRALAVGDFDGDGTPDLAEANEDRVNRLFLNNGTANPFAGLAGLDISGDQHATRALAVGDFDKDGRLDLIAGNSGDLSRIYFNNGTANPFNTTQGTTLGSAPAAVSALAAADIDKDGDLDLFAATDGGAHQLFFNTGAAAPFGNPVSLANVNAASAVLFIDADSDGDPDLIEGARDAAARLLYNDGALAAPNSAPAPWNGISAEDLSAETLATVAMAAADLNGDGLPDLIVGVENAPNRLHLNSGRADPFAGVAPVNLTSDSQPTTALAAADLNGDLRVDVVVANRGQINRVYLNNGTADPFNGVSGLDLTIDAAATEAIVIADFNGDTFPDIAAGNDGEANRIYLNNGTADPFAMAAGANISGDTSATLALAVGDVNGDQLPDLVAGNSGEPNRLYLNNGTANPFAGASGSDISGDAYFTYSVALGDIDGDGDLDLVTGSFTQPSRLYINNGTANPFAGVSGINIQSEIFNAEFVALLDIDRDGDLDLLTAFFNQPNTLHLNDGTGASFATQFGAPLSLDADNTFSLAIADFDADGLDEIVAGNVNQTDRYYTRRWHTAPARAASLEVDMESEFIRSATLTPSAHLPSNTGIDYYLSNNGGLRWFQTRPGVELTFPAFGSDLRWRAELKSLSPILTPRLESLSIAVGSIGLTGKESWRMLHWTIPELENPSLETTLWGDAADPDEDQQSNFFEYVAGLVPIDMNSRFELSIGLVPGQPTHREIMFSPRLPDRTYTVQAFPNVTSSTPTALSGAPVSDDGNVRTVTDVNPSDLKRFYRVEISLP